MTNVAVIPRRFVGPFAAADACTLVDDLMDDDRTRLMLLDFLTGELEPRDFLFKLQCNIESWAELRLNSPKNERGVDAEGEGA